MYAVQFEKVSLTVQHFFDRKANSCIHVKWRERGQILPFMQNTYLFVEEF